MKRASVRVGTAREFFERGRKYVQRSSVRKGAPKSHLITFEDAADMRSALSRGRAAARHKLITVSHRDRLIADLRADREFAAEYLNAAAAESDPDVYIAAVGDIAEAVGIARIAKAAKLRRGSLQRALSSKGKLRLSTYLAIMKAAKLKIGIVRI